MPAPPEERSAPSCAATPSRTPSSRTPSGVTIGSGKGSEVASQGSLPTMWANSSAASATLRVNGPAWSRDDAKAIMP